MFHAIRDHWPNYLIEAALLGGFMISACVCCALLEHPASPLRRGIANNLLRRGVMGLAMGLTAVILIYCPWGQRSGAHMNPATTLAFYWLGKIETADAVSYVVAQSIGGVLGVALSAKLMGAALGHPSVNYVVTVPGRTGVRTAWLGELGISFGMMFLVLLAGNSPTLSGYTGLFAGGLLGLFILVEAPLSGTSLNPARTFGSALPAGQWRAFWVYLTAPIFGMLLAAFVFIRLPGNAHVYCAKLNHSGSQPCIFHCQFGDMRAREFANH